MKKNSAQPTPAKMVLIAHHAVVILAALATFIASIESTLPKSWENTVLAAGSVFGALLSITVATVKFLDGSQKWDALTIGPPPGTALVETQTTPAATDAS